MTAIIASPTCEIFLTQTLFRSNEALKRTSRLI
jgi:hypothetical protein